MARWLPQRHPLKGREQHPQTYWQERPISRKLHLDGLVIPIEATKIELACNAVAFLNLLSTNT